MDGIYNLAQLAVDLCEPVTPQLIYDKVSAGQLIFPDWFDYKVNYDKRIAQTTKLLHFFSVANLTPKYEI